MLRVIHSILSGSDLIREVLPHYDLPGISECTLLQVGLNDTYLVSGQNRDKYILRIYRAGWRTLPQIEYELAALQHLDRKGVRVSTPIPAAGGVLILALSAPEGVRYAVLFTFAPGKPPSYDDPVKASFDYGRAAAMFHNAADSFTAPHARCLDWEHLLEQPIRAIAPVIAHREADRAYLQRLADKIRIGATKLDDALTTGLCHGDLHSGNAHLDETGRVTLFDFDCAGRGWRAYELAVFRWGARFRNQETERWESYLRGYTEIRRVEDADLAAVPFFIGPRQLWVMGIHISTADHTGAGFLTDAYFDHHIGYLREWESEYLQ